MANNYSILAWRTPRTLEDESPKSEVNLETQQWPQDWTSEGIRTSLIKYHTS